MRAMVLKSARRPLELEQRPVPVPGPGELLLRVQACAVCRTDLHVVDGELPDPKLPLVPGHEIVGVVARRGAQVERFAEGDRAGVAWVGWTCGSCRYCRSGRENLCDQARFTGYQLDGGYADYAVADARFCFVVPSRFDAPHAAPLLCAGAIGARALSLAGQAERVGLYGFGAAAHLLAQLARHQGREVYAFTRAGDLQAQQLARELGAVWAGDSATAAPEPLDAAILFAPVGALVPRALEAVRKGGVVVCAGIHMSDVPAFPYRLLWGERVLRSVANIRREDVERFLPLAAEAGLQTRLQPYPLEAANDALDDLRGGRVVGTAVLEVASAGG